ncbi:beta-glucosidase [Caldicoprobacter guelmensis]|uniref:glycoside hydrolase family 3 C-terminal domain-containing protein n=1 Tax=Caldicoprobacter guelmensis TaxID=1170224 RepID=UPI00195EE499|nr:glycoside hydrolase family 3 C-terminal domain-containing protein [Caldicoprobacter guelmensis]MBM7582201.1 beta-glucosidase [Caldicoprobacter guelmensis]
MERDIKKLISQMTLEEKASLCSGRDFWHLKGIERLGIPSIMVSDGPHGLRKQQDSADQESFFKSVPATCFPSAVGLASSWNRELVERVGAAIGEECQAEGVSILLGPGANIKRSPLCGRNFEYFSEDPYLSSEMAASHIRGVQSQGVGTSLKHFAANNQEHRRMSVDAIIDERTLREIYLASFEGAVKKGKPWTVMCSYNKVNGEYASENKYLLTDILRDDWGFEGFVVSDWGAVNDRVKGLEAGLDIEMPSSFGIGDQKIVQAVKEGRLSEEVLDRAVERILKIIFKAVDNRKENATYDREAHHQLAREVARECMVLLKNEDRILPLKRQGTIAVIGEFAKRPRYQGGGSSHVNPTKLDDIYEEIKKSAGENVNVMYAKGYSLDKEELDATLLNEAKEVAMKADVAVVFAGLPEHYESEGYDRQHMRMPESHCALIEAVAEVQPNVVVVLSNGSPIEMPWLDKVKGVLEAYLGGQALGGAIADLLFGDANPSGKLAETFPKELSHNPSYLNFPGEGDRVEYREGIFVGYRYYDKKNIEPLFPFGYGLSYTTFEYSDLRISKKEILDTETVTVTVKVKNTGEMAGKEVVQLYVSDVESSVIRPDKELKGFEKVELKPGEEKTVTFELDKRAFAYYNVDIKDWHVETGEFEILIGKSSREIVLKDRIFVKSTVTIKKPVHRNTLMGDLLSDPVLAPVVKEFLAKANEGNPLFNAREDKKEISEMMMAFMKYTPLRALVSFSRGTFTEDMLEDMIKKLNSKVMES